MITYKVNTEQDWNLIILLLHKLGKLTKFDIGITVPEIPFNSNMPNLIATKKESRFDLSRGRSSSAITHEDPYDFILAVLQDLPPSMFVTNFSVNGILYTYFNYEWHMTDLDPEIDLPHLKIINLMEI